MLCVTKSYIKLTEKNNVKFMPTNSIHIWFQAGMVFVTLYFSPIKTDWPRKFGHSEFDCCSGWFDLLDKLHLKNIMLRKLGLCMGLTSWLLPKASGKWLRIPQRCAVPERLWWSVGFGHIRMLVVYEPSQASFVYYIFAVRKRIH